MRDRLIELLLKCDKENDVLSCYNERPKRIQAAEIIADHLLENGIIVPPCKVGDTVYKVVNDKRVKKPYECKVIGFWYSEDENCNNAHLVRYVNNAFDCSFGVPFTTFGKTVFLTREEAERALKERGE